jgi:hypothetical protein
MTVSELNQFLRGNGCFIAHCASYAQGVGRPYLPPLDRMLRARTGFDPLPCSTIRPGDSLNLVGGITNYTGTIGLVIVPKTNLSICKVDPTDGGSDDASRRAAAATGVDIPISQFVRILNSRSSNDYDELVVHDYICAGVFFDRLPIEVSQVSMGQQYQWTAAELVASLGTTLPYFFLHAGVLFHTAFDQVTARFRQGGRVDLSTIYP